MKRAPAGVTNHGYPAVTATVERQDGLWTRRKPAASRCTQHQRTFFTRHHYERSSQSTGPNRYKKKIAQRKAREEQEDTRQGRRTEPARLCPRAPDSRKLTHTKGMKQSSRCDLARTPGRVCGLGQSHWQDTRPKLAENLGRGRSPGVRVVSQSPVGSAAEDAQHSRKSGSRRDAPQSAGV